MLRSIALLLLLLLAAGCDVRAGGMGSDSEQTLSQARAGFTTKLTEKSQDGTPAPIPPRGVLELVHYPAPSGKMSGYLTPRPKGPGKHPAIIWISGGDSNSIGDFWSPGEPDNDQTAAAFRDAGIVTFYPSLRGGNDNPGYREGFMGEVDDILAAAEWLTKQDYVDPNHIYLGGHSTGGTMVMLAAEMSDRFRATFAFGPADDVRGYGGDYVYANLDDDREMKLRSPSYWLASVRKPLFVFEGRSGNIESLEAMRDSNSNSAIAFYGLAEHSHFSLLAPVSRLIAQKILAEAKGGAPIAFTEAELASVR